MRLFKIVVFIALSLMIFSAPDLAFSEQPPTTGVSNLNAFKLIMRDNFLIQTNEGGLWLLAAFIPTNSTSRKCLATWNSSFDWTQVEKFWCSFRPKDGVPGLSVQVLLRNGFDPDWWELNFPDQPIVVSLTIFQDQAIYYGVPVPDIP